MLEPLEPGEFCLKWLPKFKNLYPEQYGYRKACCEFLAELTGYGTNTVNNWLTDSTKTPLLVKRYLRAIDLLWQLEIILLWRK
jgi:hypothetical protein